MSFSTHPHQFRNSQRYSKYIWRYTYDQSLHYSLLMSWIPLSERILGPSRNTPSDHHLEMREGGGGAYLVRQPQSRISLGLPGRTTMATTLVETTALLGARSLQSGRIRPASEIFMMSSGRASAAMSAGRPSMMALACIRVKHSGFSDNALGLSWRSQIPSRINIWEHFE